MVPDAPPSSPAARAARLNDRAASLAGARRFDEALALLDEAIALDGTLSSAHFNRALVLLLAGRAQEALASADRAIACRPESPEAWNLRGQVLGTMQRTAEALTCFERALALRPGFAEAAANRTIAQGALAQRASEVLATLDAASQEGAPSFAAMHVNRGNVLFTLGRNEEALAAFDAALARDPHDAKTHVRRGAVLAHDKRHAEAAAAFAHAHALDPALPALRGLLLHARANACDWRGYDDEAAALVQAVRRGESVVSPLVMLALTDAADVQHACAKSWVALDAPAVPEPLWQGERYGHARIRVGYLSSDLDEHAVAYLVAGAIEAHDRTRFETVAFHTGRPSSTPMHVRMRAAFDGFVDATELTDAALAARIRAEEIDVLVDLNGHTHGSRMRALAMRPAPACVSYLGFPGTLGADYVDCALVDRVVVPPASRLHWSERLIDLPGGFQANDARRPLPVAMKRADAALPGLGLVFAAFGNSYKINPATFGVWMEILQACDGSVLWLLEGEPALAGNLRREAHARGIDPARLLFAARLPYRDHLSRLALADVFLDTFPFNGGATASDALWCGVPVITRMGEAMASRMAGALLHAVDLPELATPSDAAYAEAAIALARDASRRQRLRERLVRARTSCGLFDSVRFCRELETALAVALASAIGDDRQ
ncbi:MAG: tetratricopeptide repeat protein [Burkholderiales bacterium]